jgi:hypothetical protein
MANRERCENARRDEHGANEQPAVVAATFLAGLAHEMSEHPAEKIFSFAILLFQEAQETERAVNQAKNCKYHEGKNETDTHKAPPAFIIYRRFFFSTRDLRVRLELNTEQLYRE